MTEKEKKEVCDKCDISYVCDYKSTPDCVDLKEKEIKSKDDCRWFGARTPQKPCGQCNKNCQYNDNKIQKDCQKEVNILASDIDYAITSRDISLEDRREIAKALVLLGYGKVEDYKKCLTNAIKHFLKEMEKYEGEIERLMKDNEKLIEENSQLCNSLTEASTYIKDITNDLLAISKSNTEIKKQAIQEFSEKLSNKFYYLNKKPYDTMHNFEIDDLVNINIDILLKEYGVEL